MQYKNDNSAQLKPMVVKVWGDLLRDRKKRQRAKKEKRKLKKKKEKEKRKKKREKKPYRE